MSTDAACPPKNRILAIDALRGFDMFWIIGGSGIFIGLAEATDIGFLSSFTVQLEHVEWEGFHFLDLIWPLFYFIVGLSLPFSLGKRLLSGMSKGSLYYRITKRTAILFAIGMVLQGGLLKYDLNQLYPFYSVLHGIAAGYFFASLIVLNLRLAWQLVTTAGLLLLYWALMMFVPVPGHGAGILTPEINLATYIDRTIQGSFHYGANTWFLSYMTFAASVMLGVFASRLLQSGRNARQKLLWLILAGVGCITAGLIWSLWFPIIKLAWTSSYVLFAGGFCYLLLALFFGIIDVLGFRRWTFALVVIGMNPIAIYSATMLFDFKSVGNIFVGGLSDRLGVWNDVVQAGTAFAVVWLILYWMYRKRTFIKI